MVTVGLEPTSATSMVVTPHCGDHSLSVEKAADEIPSTGGHRRLSPIDVNDVLSAPATFVQEKDEFPIRLQSRSYKGFHKICTRVRLHPQDRVRFFICTQVHDLCTLFAPGCR